MVDDVGTGGDTATVTEPLVAGGALDDGRRVVDAAVSTMVAWKSLEVILLQIFLGVVFKRRLLHWCLLLVAINLRCGFLTPLNRVDMRGEVLQIMENIRNQDGTASSTEAKGKIPYQLPLLVHHTHRQTQRHCC